MSNFFGHPIPANKYFQHELVGAPEPFTAVVRAAVKGRERPSWVGAPVEMECS